MPVFGMYVYMFYCVFICRGANGSFYTLEFERKLSSWRVSRTLDMDTLDLEIVINDDENGFEN